AGAMLAQAISPPPRCAGSASRSLTASLPRRAGGGESIFGGALRHAAVAGLNYQVIKRLLTAVAPTASSFRGYPDYRSRAYRHDVVVHTELAFTAQEEIHLFVELVSVGKGHGDSCRQRVDGYLHAAQPQLLLEKMFSLCRSRQQGMCKQVIHPLLWLTHLDTGHVLLALHRFFLVKGEISARLPAQPAQACGSRIGVHPGFSGLAGACRWRRRPAGTRLEQTSCRRTGYESAPGLGRLLQHPGGTARR